MVLQKARSRLHQPLQSHPETLQTSQRLTAIAFPAKRRDSTVFKWSTTVVNNSHIHTLWQLVKPFVRRWPQLVIGSCVFFALWRLLSTYTPAQVAHVLWPNSYLPVIGLWFIAQWYFGSFWLHQSRRGLWWATITTAWLYARLQYLIIPGWFWWSLLGSWVALELILRKIYQLRTK